MSDIQPGDVVVCVDASPCGCCGNVFNVRVGGAYRIAKLWHLSDRLNVSLANHNHGAAHISLPATRFRRLNDEPDDIALIRKIKARKPARQPIHAGDGQ